MRCVSLTKLFLWNPPAMITEKPHCSLDVVQHSTANVVKITCICQKPKASCSALGQYSSIENKRVLSESMHVIPYYIRLLPVVTSVQNLFFI